MNRETRTRHRWRHRLRRRGRNRRRFVRRLWIKASRDIGDYGTPGFRSAPEPRTRNPENESHGKRDEGSYAISPPSPPRPNGHAAGAGSDFRARTNISPSRVDSNLFMYPQVYNLPVHCTYIYIRTHVLMVLFVMIRCTRFKFVLPITRLFFSITNRSRIDRPRSPPADVAGVSRPIE